jgi:hypothetical protein
MARHHSHRSNGTALWIKTTVGLGACIIVMFLILTPVLKGHRDRYRIDRVDGSEAQTTEKKTDERGFGNAEDLYASRSIVEEGQFISRENASIYVRFVTPLANKALKRLESELSDYYMLTNWIVPYTSVNRLPDLKYMSVEDVSQLKVVVYRDDNLWLLNMDEIADMSTFKPGSGYIKFRFPLDVMAYALFEVKHDV